MQYKVVWSKGASIRPAPNTGGSSISTLVYGQVFDVLQDNIADTTDPNNVLKRWLKVANGYVASDYPDSLGNPAVRCQLVNAPPPSGTYTVTLKDDVTGETWAGTLTKA